MFTERRKKKLPRKVKIHPREKEDQEGEGWLKDYWQILTPKRNAPEHGLCPKIITYLDLGMSHTNPQVRGLKQT